MITRQQKQIEALTAGLQKVSARLVATSRFPVASFKRATGAPRMANIISKPPTISAKPAGVGDVFRRWIWKAEGPGFVHARFNDLESHRRRVQPLRRLSTPGTSTGPIPGNGTIGPGDLDGMNPNQSFITGASGPFGVAVDR